MSSRGPATQAIAVAQKLASPTSIPKPHASFVVPALAPVHGSGPRLINAINGTTDGEESASLLAIGVRGDWKPAGRLSVYSLVNYDRNRFANIGRRFEEGAGLGYLMIDRPRHRLTTELGSQFVQQQNLEKVSDNFLAGRAAELYRYTIKDGTYFEERVEFLPNFETSDDYRVNGEASLVAPLSRHLALKLGYVVRFDNVTEPDVKKSDRFFTSGLQVSF